MININTNDDKNKNKYDDEVTQKGKNDNSEQRRTVKPKQ